MELAVLIESLAPAVQQSVQLGLHYQRLLLCPGGPGGRRALADQELGTHDKEERQQHPRLVSRGTLPLKDE